MNALDVSTDPARLDVSLIHRFLSQESHWARGISRSLLEKALRHSLCFGGFLEGMQVAFARVVSDYATYAYLMDVFVVPAHRGRGFSKRLMQAVVQHPDLQGLRRFTLATRDAHGLYAQFGFRPLANPQTFMERYVPDVYARATEGEGRSPVP